MTYRVITTLHRLTPAQKRALGVEWKQSGSTADYPGTALEADEYLRQRVARLHPGHPDYRPLQTLWKVFAQYFADGSHPRITTVDTRPAAEPVDQPAAEHLSEQCPCEFYEPAGYDGGNCACTHPKDEHLGAHRCLHREKSEARNVVELRPAAPSKIRNFRCPTPIWDGAAARAELRGETVTAVLVAALREYAEAGGFTIDGQVRVVGERPLF